MIDFRRGSSLSEAATPPPPLPSTSSSSSSSSRTSQVDGAVHRLQSRLRVVEKERHQFELLEKKAYRAFEDHRAELTQLMQKERALGSYREDHLRNDLNQLLEENRQVTAQIAEQRAAQEAALRGELQQRRNDNGERLRRLEDVLTALHAERDALQRNRCEAEGEQAAYKQSITECLQDQQQLRQQIGCLHEALLHLNTPEVVAPSRQKDNAADSCRCRFLRQPRCFCCDVSPNARGSLPRRRFIPNGPPDAGRVASPSSHHVEAIVSTIERTNYLRPRLNIGRVAQEPPPPASAVRRPTESGTRGQPASLQSPCRSSFLPTRRWGRMECCCLHPTTSSRTKRRCSPPRSAFTENHHSSCSTSTPSDSCHSVKSQHEVRCSCQTTSHQQSDINNRIHCTGAVTPAPVEVKKQQWPSTPVSPRGTTASPRRSATEPPFGNAVNATCRALLDELAGLRHAYTTYQQQLRDPHGNSVEASQQMRRIMRQMDAKVDQVRTLRREQARYQPALRVGDVLRQVVEENQYCEQVYRDLIDLIRA